MVSDEPDGGTVGEHLGGARGYGGCAVPERDDRIRTDAVKSASHLHPSPRDGGWPTVAARQLRKFPSPRARRTGAIRYGKSRGKGTETTQIRLTG